MRLVLTPTQSLMTLTSLVNIAMRPRHRRNQILDHIRLPVNIEHLQIYHVRQLLRAAVEPDHARPAGNDLLALVKVLRLPDVPGAVDHGVVEPKGWVAGGDVKVYDQRVSMIYALEMLSWGDVPDPGSPLMVKCPAECTPVPACMVDWKVAISLEPVMSAAILAVVASRWVR
jgi:hypothetical protein